MKAGMATSLGAGLVGIVIASAAWATIPGADGTIHACYDNQSGQVRIYDAEDGPIKNCGKNETATFWSQTGPQGPQGPQGIQGDPGPKGDTGDRGPKGDTGMSGLETVTATSDSDSTSPKSASAQCPEGKALIAGGGEVSGLGWESVYINIDRPYTKTDPPEWQVYGFEVPGGTDEDWQVTAYAICAVVG